MGISSDGLLIFGFPVGDEGEVPEWLAVYDDFDDFLATTMSISESLSYTDRQRIIDTCPADVFVYCSGDYPMHILGIRGAGFRVRRGYTTEVQPSLLTVPQEKIDAFKAWCEQAGIEWQEPKWLLCSYLDGV
jgi:hypothetical protein